MNETKRKIDIISLSLMIVAMIIMIYIQAVSTAADAVILIIVYALIMVLILLAIMLQIKGFVIFYNERKNAKDKEVLDRINAENSKKVKKLKGNKK